ncbi:GIP, partial [Symbiodinium sp. KB8]
MEFQKGICRFRNTEFQKGICKLGDMEFQKGICKLGDMEFQKGIFKLGNTEFQKGIFRLGDMEFQKGISRLLEGISMDTEFHIAQVLWSRVVQARNLYGGDHGRLSVGQGGGLFTGSRERGGMFDVAPGDVAYRQPEIQRGATFGDYDYEIGGSNPPRLSGPDGGLDYNNYAVSNGRAYNRDAVQELAKLPEYAPETGAIDFQDFLYLAEQQIGSLASGAGDWWSRTLAVAQESYAEYQAMSPMRRLSVKPTLTSELRDERYKKLERKVAALLLAALPKSVREEMIAYRVQGTHQILFRLMIVYQPGGAQDRAQLLRQLDVTESAAGPVEAIASLRRWYRLLQRAADIGVKLPDESIQTRSLTMIVKKTADSFPDFKFRMALARTELQIDTRPTQDSVMRYLQHLLAELEHLGGNKKPAAATGTATTTSTTSAATTTLKGIQTQGDATPKAKAKSVAEKPCKYFATEDGCRRGRDCTFTHAWDGLQRSDRCLLCGSTKHRMKECPARKSSPSDKVSEILNETNKVLKAISASKAAPPSQPPPSTSAPAALDPLAMIQQQINEIRGLRALVVQKDAGENMGFQSAVAMYEARLRASSVALGQGDQEALLDSGATHPLRGPSSQSEWNQARQVAVSLATGEEIMLRQNPGGTLLNGEPEGSPIIPMGQLVTLLGCSVHWTPSKLVVHHPVHGRLRVRMKGFCPVLPVSKALELISELEAARLKRFEDSIEDLRKQVSMIREQGRDGWSWQQHLRSLCEDGTRTSMAGFLHRCPTFAGVDAEALLGIPESVPCDPKDGWKLLKGAPWSRAKRKQMYQSDGWVVHLFAGDEKTSDSKTQSIMRNSFWQQALSGSEVLVEVDITATRSMDLNKQDGIFRVLAWAALSGRIKAVIGGPPRQTIPTPSQGARSQDQYHKELQLVVRMMALWYMAEEGRCKRWRQGLLQTPTVKPHVAFLLEHPEAKCREHVSLFQTSLWRMFALDALMGEVQLEINGKPTVLGGLKGLAGTGSSTFNGTICRIDVTVEFALNARVDGVGGYKYLMVACYRLPRLTETKSETDSLEQEESAVELKAPEDGGDWLFEDDDDGGGVGPMVKEDEAEQLGDVRGDGDDEDGEVEELKELAEPLEYMNLYMTRPLRTRTKAEALRVIQEFYIQLRSSGFPVNRLHMDRAREFQSAALEVWAASRDVEVTRTQGDDPLQNGAAERAVGYIKGESEENLQLAEVEAYRDLVGVENKAKLFTASRRFSMEDCLHVLTSTEFLRTRKQRVSAWSSNEPPPVHTTLGAYQRGPFVGLTKATTRHQDLAVYLNKFFKKQCGEELRYTSIPVAKNLHTGVHCDRFNLRNSENTVITVGDFEGGGIWQEGVSPIHPTVEIEAPNGSILKGFVQPVQNRVVKVDPKRLHMSMPWTGGTKWTLIAHTIGSKAKLNDDEVETLQGLGFPYPECSEQAQLASAQADLVVFEYEDQCLKDLSEENLHVSDGDEEWRCRYWMRRLLDEEEQLKEVVPPDLSSDFLGVDAANENCLRYLELRENFVVHERRDVHQWMQLSRLVESEQEMHGVEMVLETLEGPLQVVYTVALEDVKQNISLWSEAIHKEAKALLDAGALVPMTAEEQRKLVSTGNLVILPAKGVFTVKPPDDAVTVDGDGNPLPRGSPVFWKRKARLVICGNFQQKQAQEDSYAGGCQIDSLRAMLVFGMLRNWCFASTDIRNAFILAPIKDEEDEDQSEVYALMPPKVFQLARVPYSLQLWRVDRALYGFRRSPRLWSRFRDRRLKAARIPYGAGFLLLCQSRADANVWAITYVLDGKEEILGYLNIYVDDVLYVGQAQVIFAVQEWLTQDWKASELSWATSESAIRFLGLEIEASEGRVKINQCGYIKELLRHHDQAEGPGHATPCPPEWLVGDRVFDQVEHTEAQLRRAQVLTGELLWLSGRSRPDLMHAVATMSCLCLRNPLLVEKIGLRVLSYLRETLNYALIYQPTAEGHVLALLRINVDNAAAVALCSEAAGYESYKTFGTYEIEMSGPEGCNWQQQPPSNTP